MARDEQRRAEPVTALDSINSRTGRNMPQAVATGALLVAMVLAAALLGPDVFVPLIVVFMVLGLWELRVDFATVGLHIPVITLWVCSTITLLTTYYLPRHLLALGVCLMLTVIVVTITATTHIELGTRVSLAVAGKLSVTDASARLESSFADMGEHSVRGHLENIAVSLLTVLYIPLLAGFIILPLTFGGHQPYHVFISVFLPALSDIGGLFAGAWLGRHPLSPRISPKKSWEGLYGSMLLSTAGAYAIVAIGYDGSIWPRLWWAPLVLGMMTGIVGTFGDLCASMIKRDIGIKDMGHLLKGHGGVLDRVDSILMSAPFITLMLYLTGL